MLTEVEITNLRKVNEILDGFRASQANAEKELKGIDEKYKAMIERDKKSYKEIIASCKKEIEFWEKPFLKRYGRTIAELLTKPEEASEEAQAVEDNLPFDDDEKVVDEQEEASEETVEAPVEKAVEEEIPVVVEDLPEETEEAEEAEEAESSEDDGWGDDEPEKQDDNNGWGEFPAGWK